MVWITFTETVAGTKPSPALVKRVEGNAAVPQAEWPHHSVTAKGGLLQCLGIGMPQKAQKPTNLIGLGFSRPTVIKLASLGRSCWEEELQPRHRASLCSRVLYALPYKRLVSLEILIFKIKLIKKKSSKNVTFCLSQLQITTINYNQLILNFSKMLFPGTLPRNFIGA